MSIKILVVDDSAFMRSMLTRMIKKDSRFDIVGQAKNGEEAVAMVKELKPDIVTLDIEMPVMDGLTALGHIMKESPTRVVMVSSLTTEGAESTLEALEKGAVDFIPKAMEGGGQNILHASDLLIEKLLAAAEVRVRGTLLRERPAPISRQPATPSAASEKPETPVRTSMVERAIARKADAPADDKKKTRSAIASFKKLPTAKLFILGSSTGGPRALQDVLPHLPSSLRVPLVIAQHMPGSFTGPMADRLDSSSLLKIVEAKDGDVLEAGVAYVAPGGVHTRIHSEGGRFILRVKEDQGNECVYKPSVDILAESASEAAGGNVLAVMLTGMGADGAKGFESLKQKGSYVVAQDEETSVVYGMPKSVAHVADEILPIEEIADAVKRLLS